MPNLFDEPPERPSDELVEYRDVADWFRASWNYAFSEHPEIGVAVHQHLKKLMESLEGLSDRQIEGAQNALLKERKMWEWIADWWYTKEVLELLPHLERRFLQLAPALAIVTPKSDVNTYLREATRCYIYGFFEASIALSRAALEAGLKDILRQRFGNHAESLKLIDGLKSAGNWRLLSGPGIGMAKDLAKAAGMVLHQKPAKTESLAFDTLSRCRAVLKELYED